MKVKLTEICTPKQWKTIPTNELLGEGYPVYGANGIIGYYNEYNHENSVVTITCRGATCGTINITEPKSYITGNAMCLDNLRSGILLEYLYYCLLHYNFRNVISGSAQPQITRQGLEKVEIEICSIEEQKKRITTLNKINVVIAARQQQLQKLDDLVKARFVELFGDPLSNDKGWQKVLITEVCHAIFGGGTPSKSHPEYFTGSIPWVSPKDMKSLVINDSIDHITEKAIAHSTTNLVPANSVLMVIRSGILKHTLPVAVNSLPVTINQDMKAFVPNDTVKTAFLTYFFKAIENDVLADVRGVTADNIDFKAFQKRTIIVPPLALQEQFAAFVTQADKSKVAIQKALDEAQLLFDSLMQKYFG